MIFGVSIIDHRPPFSGHFQALFVDISNIPITVCRILSLPKPLSDLVPLPYAVNLVYAPTPIESYAATLCSGSCLCPYPCQILCRRTMQLILSVPQPLSNLVPPPCAANLVYTPTPVGSCAAALCSDLVSTLTLIGSCAVAQ